MSGSHEFALLNALFREIKVKDYKSVITTFLTDRLETPEVNFFKMAYEKERVKIRYLNYRRKCSDVPLNF